MQKIVLGLALILCGTGLNAQNFKELAAYEFKAPENYQEQESNVLACANYLFANPMEKEEYQRAVATKFIMDWMIGTPDYTLNFGDGFIEVTTGNEELVGMYMAAATKTILENNSEKTLTDETIHNLSVELLVAYCADKDNKLKPSKALKKIIKANKKS
jgi:hypothetical protein